MYNSRRTLIAYGHRQRIAQGCTHWTACQKTDKHMPILQSCTHRDLPFTLKSIYPHRVEETHNGDLGLRDKIVSTIHHVTYRFAEGVVRPHHRDAGEGHNVLHPLQTLQVTERITTFSEKTHRGVGREKRHAQVAVCLTSEARNSSASSHMWLDIICLRVRSVRVSRTKNAMSPITKPYEKL